MQLDSKESDIEQLRRKILDLQQGMDCTSVASLQTDEADGNLSGKRKACLNYLILCRRVVLEGIVSNKLLSLKIFSLSLSISHLQFLSEKILFESLAACI